MPITWKNVTGQESRTGVALLQGAENSITAGLAGLKGLVDDRVEMKDANMLNAKKNNTQTMLDGLAQYTNVDDYEAAMADGSIDALRNSLGPNIDKAAVRDAEPNRLKELRSSDLATQTFETDQLKKETAPMVENIRQLIQDKQYASANTLIDENQSNLDTLGLTSSLKNANEDREIEALERDRTEAIYQSTKLSEKHVNTISKSAPTEMDAVAEITKNRVDGISEADHQANIAKVRTSWQQLRGLSKEQSEEINSVANTAKVQAKSQRDESSRQFEIVKRDNQWDPNFAWLSDETQQIQSAVEIADRNNWDNNENAADIRAARASTTEIILTDINAIRKTKGLEKLTTLDSADAAALERVIEVAVSGMGDGEAWFGLAEEELRDSDFNEEVLRVWRGYEQAQLGKAEVDAAEKIHISNLQAADLFEVSLVSRHKEMLQDSNRNKLSLQSAVKAVSSN